MKTTLELTEEQLSLVQEALDFYSRIGIVQFCLTQPRHMLITDPLMPEHGSWGIYNSEVDDSCRIAFDIIQVIRHEKWKMSPNRSSVTVDSHIHFSHTKDGSSNEIKCFLNTKYENNKD